MIKICPKCTAPAIPRGKFCQEHRTGKNCIEPLCGNIAVRGGKPGYCISHGGGVKILCIVPKCENLAVSGGKPGCCVSHGGGKRCIEPDCKNVAQRGGKSGYCKKHGGGKRCIEPLCGNAAQGGGKPGYCVKHGGGQRCIEPDCGNVAVSGGKPDCCITHGGGKKCIEPLCGNVAVSGGKPDCCWIHGGGVKILCIEPLCGNFAHSGGKSGCCKAHGGGQRCPNCITWIDSRVGDPKYDGYCATCFKVVFPTDERSKVIYQHTKEIMVRNIINANFDGFIHDTPLYTGDCDCTHRRRIDHRKLIGNTILAIETDEFTHRYYDKEDEEIRYNDVYMIHSGKWIFIRFNPDDTKTIKVDIEDKLICLIETIQKHIYRIENDENEEPVEIHPMYFDL